MSKRKEIDPEFRIWLIEECLAGRMRGREAARRAGISSSAMRKWISLYKMDGPAAFASSNAKRTYSEEIKKKVVKDYLRGFSYRQVYEWVRKHRKFGIAGLEDRRGERKISQTPRSKEEELEKRIAELEHENHLLKLECELRKKWKNWKGEIAETVSSGTAVRSRSPLYG